MSGAQTLCSQKLAIAALHSHIDRPSDVIASICQEAAAATGALADALCPEGCLSSGGAAASEVLRSVQQLAASELEEPFMVRCRMSRTLTAS